MIEQHVAAILADKEIRNLILINHRMSLELEPFEEQIDADEEVPEHIHRIDVELSKVMMVALGMIEKLLSVSVDEAGEIYDQAYDALPMMVFDQYLRENVKLPDYGAAGK